MTYGYEEDSEELRFSESVYVSVRSSILSAKSSLTHVVNSAMVLTYWDIGRMIYEAAGERAVYCSSLLQYLSKKLIKEFGSGFDAANLRRMRQFYMTFPRRDELRSELSWTHYKLLISVSDERARSFYLEEAIKANWSTRQMERQIHSFYYERLLASSDKDAVYADAAAHEVKGDIADCFKDPYVLEFLNLKANSKFLESDLEQALIDNLEEFMLELGRGFAFVARQKRISFDNENFYIDLVFYNYIMKCFVLIDLKTGRLTHQDLGQMQMYVNYYTRELMNEGDNPPIGIVLCADKSDSLVHYTLPEGQNQIFAAKYMLCLPKEEELASLLDEWCCFHEAGAKYEADF